jgi:hypothetical protein
MKNGHLFSGTEIKNGNLDTLDFDNGILSVRAYTDMYLSFGLRLRSPFSPSADIGLPPYPDSLGPALRCTSLLLSLYFLHGNILCNACQDTSAF